MIAMHSVRRPTRSARAALFIAVLLALLLLATLRPSAAHADSTFSITGRGYGHGIGMSQWGAKGYADHGYTYTQILGHYYTNTVVGTTTTKNVSVELDDGADPRSSWSLRAGYVGGRLVVNGVVTPVDVTYTFKPVTSGVAVYNGTTLWKTFTSPVQVVSQTEFVGTGTYEEDNAALSHSGMWVRQLSSAWSGGGCEYSYTAGSTVSMTFSGTSLTILGAKNTNYGQFSVSIDGGTPVTVDTYATAFSGSTAVYSATSLTEGVHSVTIQVLGTKNTASTGTVVILDAIQIGGSTASISTVAVPLVQVVDASGPMNFAYVRYRGALNLTLTGGQLRLLNTLNIEDYLYGVVPRESPSSWPAEALKAQAVAARSYAYTEPSGTLYCTTMSQVYNGHSRTAADRTDVEMHEMTSTNAAVDATDSQVVKYGSSIARTYFFSSSGGHTANSEDVWTAAVPYLRGVPDPYEAGAAPATGWPWTTSWGAPITYTGTALATELGYSSAVTAVSCDTAPSGHVRRVYLTFANGTTANMRGDTFRSKLGLKSTVFRVALATEAGRVEETSSRVTYAGTWTSASSSAFSGGAYRYSAKAGATATIRTTATSVAIVGSYGPSYGKAEVWIDGVKAGTMDAYASTYAHSKVLFSKTGLAAGTHTVVVKVLGTRNTLSTGVVFILDAFDFSGVPVDPAPQPVLETGRIEESSSRFSYAGTWFPVSSSAFSGGAYRYSNKAGSTATVRVTATSVGIVGSYGPTYGKAEVIIDGVSAGVIDPYAASYAHNQVLFSKTGLTAGTHTVVVKVLGTKNASSSGTVFVLDAVDCSGAPVNLKPGVTPESGRVEDSSNRLGYSGTWVSVASTAFSGGSYRYSLKAGSTATMQTTATSVAIVGSYGPSYGKAEVLIDGVSAGVIDPYAESYAHNKVLFSKTGLAAGYHTVVVKVLGTKNAESSGVVFVFDAVDFSGAAVDPAPGETGRVEENSSRVSYSAAWMPVTSSAFSGGSYCYSSWAGRSATMQTTGTSVSIVGSYGPSYGKAELFIDDVSVGVIDAYAPSYLHSKVLFSKTGLAPGVHTVRLVSLGTKNASSSGTVFVLDAFDFSGIAVDPAPTGTASASGVSVEAAAGAGEDARASGDASASSSPEATATP